MHPKKQISWNKMILYVSKQIFYAQCPSNSGWGPHSALYQGCMKLDLRFLPLSLQLIQHFSSNCCMKGAVLKLLSKILVGHDWTSNRTSTASVTTAKTALGPSPSWITASQIKGNVTGNLTEQTQHKSSFPPSQWWLLPTAETQGTTGTISLLPQTNQNTE